MASEAAFRLVRIQQPEAHLLAGVLAMRRALMAHHQRTPPEEHFIERVTRRLDDETMFLVLGLDGETPMAYALAFDVAEHPFMPDWEHAGYITHFFVAPAYRKQGVGKALLATLMTWFASRAIAQVMLNVAVENAEGNGFWREQGFLPVATRMKRQVDPQALQAQGARPGDGQDL